jgi:hypothetical protein
MAANDGKSILGLFSRVYSGPVTLSAKHRSAPDLVPPAFQL